MDPKKASQASHHLHLAHARTVAAFREKKVKGQIGIVHCLSPLHDMDQTAGSARNASIVDGLWNRWYLDPSLKGRYPADIMDLKIKKGTAPDIVKGDMDIIKNNICDFLGVNFYFRFRVYDTGDRPFNWQECVNSKPFPGAKITEMGWEVYPKGIYELLERINKEYGKFPVYIMENGMAAKDKVLPDGKIEDDDRLEYVKMHLSECKRAIDSGFNLKGYYYWSLMDNFEWTSGYSKRFGLVRVDYDTLKRTVKKSGGWYGEFIKGQKSI
jgi:beta-glucosidase/6-phospho-beta-glucosidase/beta-galactosidase